MATGFESHIIDRLERLESKNRRLKWFGAFFFLWAAALTVVVLYLLLPIDLWFGLPRTVQGNRFVLLDHKGRERGTWEMSEGPILSLLTEKGTVRAMLSVNHDAAASLFRFDNANFGRAAILSVRDKETALRFREGKATRAQLSAEKDKVGLQFFDEQGKVLPQKP